MHFDNVNTEMFYYSIKSMTQVNDDDAMIIFGDKEGYVGESSTVSESFKFSTTLEKFDTFVSYCNNEEGDDVNVIQYIGIETIDNTDYFVTWHTGVDLEDPITCEYPELIQNSVSRNFGV